MFDVEYYVDGSGACPAKDFIDSLTVKMKVKAMGRLALLEQYGPLLGMPFARHLDDGIFELRCVQGSDITRILYFFMSGEKAVVTHGFVKKTQKTPPREIVKAKRIRLEWRSRNE